MNDTKETSIDATRDLLFRYLDGSLEDEEKAEVEDLIDKNEEALRELQEIETLTAIIRDNGVVFCPDPLAISNFLEHGEDPTESISKHLKTCNSCQKDVEMLQTSLLKANMPGELLRAIAQELSRQVPQEPVARFQGWLHTVLDSFLSHFRFRMLAAGAIALAFLVVMFVYQRDSITRMIGENSVTWNHVVKRLHTSFSSANSVHKPNLAIILLFEDFKQPLSQPRIDALYNSLKPAEEDLERYDMIASPKLSRTIAETKLEATNVDGILNALRKEHDLEEVVLVTVRSTGDRFAVRSKLIKTSTGKVVEENAAVLSSYSELKSGLRRITYSVLSNKK